MAKHSLPDESDFPYLTMAKGLLIALDEPGLHAVRRAVAGLILARRETGIAADMTTLQAERIGAVNRSVIDQAVALPPSKERTAEARRWLIRALRATDS